MPCLSLETTQPQWILEPHPTANNPIGSLTPHVHFEIKQVKGEIKRLEAGRVAALAPKSLKETAFTALLPRDERVKKDDWSDRTHLESCAHLSPY